MQQGSVTRDAERHYLQESLANGLSDCQVLGSSGQVSCSLITACEDVAAASGPHGFPGTVSLGSNSDALPSVTVEGQFVSSVQPSSSASSPVTRMQRMHCLVASVGEVNIGSPTPLFLYTDVSLTG